MRYLYRCPDHGIFEVYQSIHTTTPKKQCPERHRHPSGDYAPGLQCQHEAPKVLGSPHIIFSGGKDYFHESTVKERTDKAVGEARSEGLDPVPLTNADLSQRHDAGHGRVYYDGTHPDKERKQKARKAAEKAMDDPRSKW